MNAEEITTAQDLHLRLIAAVGIANTFNGPAIADSLRAHSLLWRAAVITRETRLSPQHAAGAPLPLAARVCLIHLRDLPHDHVNLNTLFILPRPGTQDQLEALARSWRPDNVTWFHLKEACQAMGEAAIRHRGFNDPSRFLLKVWWD